MTSDLPARFPVGAAVTVGDLEGDPHPGWPGCAPPSRSPGSPRSAAGSSPRTPSPSG
ncbi:hypothetical protein [Actinomadura sp. WMMB 499]|uniref:hypothetical protein n=1 Tax=Actinomadura sp. WMMB 499 TaxID=1219491 RepID=UPI0020C7F89E|nr:hypothetical protein [Actinomadura sp. WMMB 499]